LDPMMGIVGGLVILKWSVALSRGAARQLLDVVACLIAGVLCELLIGGALLLRALRP
jgi:Co/Zn/Cd efflux system component